MINPCDFEILVVEDSAVQAEMLRRILVDEGYRVSVAEDGAQALQLLRRRKLSLVISDVIMPIMDGYTMCHEIKHDDNLRDIPVILLTDLSDPRDVIKGLKARADNYVTKPYHTNLLLSRIENLLTNPADWEDKGQRETLHLNYGGESYSLSSSPRQILNLLISTYENAVHQHQDLVEAQNNLVTVNDELEEKLRELQESEQRFSVLVQTIPDIVYRIDKNGGFVFVNDAVRCLGYEPEELVGKHFSHIVLPVDVEHVSRDQVLAKYRGRITGPEGAPKLFDERRTGERITKNLEVRLIPKNKQTSTPAVIESFGAEVVIVEVNSSGLYAVPMEHEKKFLSDTGGLFSKETTAAMYLGTVGVIRDITDRKLAEAALHSSEERFRQLVQTATSIIVLLSPDNLILEWNTEAERVFGLTWDQALGKDFCSLFGYSEQRERMATTLANVLLGEAVRYLETRLRQDRGGEQIVLWNISMLLDSFQKPLGAIAVGQDVTEWKRSEEERLNAQARAEMGRMSDKVATETIDGMVDAVVLVNPEGKITLCNHSVSKSLGWGKEIIGRPLMQLLEEEGAAAVENGLEACLSGSGVASNIECTVITKDNRKIPTLLNATLVKDADGKPARIIAVLRDITELKQAMGALTEHAIALARANAELKQFAHISSHHLQEPLRKVANFSELLAMRYKGQLDERADRYIRYVVEGATRIQALISGLLIFTGLDRYGPMYEDLNLNEIVRTIVSTLDPIARAEATVLVEELPSLCADSREVGLLFQELISNAIKFRGENPPNVHITARKKGGQWVFSVRDNGKGIDPLYAEQVFDIFKRLDPTGGGHDTGIGLALAKKIVERHGGTIWFESQRGEGSVFYFTIPATDEQSRK